MLWEALAGIVAGFVLLWLGLVVVLWLNRPSEIGDRGFHGRRPDPRRVPREAVAVVSRVVGVAFY